MPTTYGNPQPHPVTGEMPKLHSPMETIKQQMDLKSNSQKEDIQARINLLATVRAQGEKLLELDTEVKTLKGQLTSLLAAVSDAKPEEGVEVELEVEGPRTGFPRA